MKKLKMPSEATRAYIYRVLLVAVPLLVVFGVIKNADAALWLALGGAVLGLGGATANTSTKGQ